MKTNALEEVTLTQDANKQEPPPEETPEQETTAIVPTEPDVIEGEVIVIETAEPSEDHRPPKQKPYWLLIPLTIFFCLVFVASSFLVPLFTPSATITLIPVERTFTTTAAIKAQARAIAPLTLSQSATVPATGKRHQTQTVAQGSITFFNGLYISQTVAEGTILTGAHGLQVITDQPAVIPEAFPPGLGQTTISAHAIDAGAQGDIPAGDINQECCLTAVKAVNTEAFTGGQNARDYLVVTMADIQNAAAPLKASLSQSEQAAVTAQLNPGEALLRPPCKPVVSSTHKPGMEATQVTVTVSETCRGIAYISHDVYASATQMITKDAANQLGTGYSPIGNIQTTIVQTTTTTTRQGSIQIIVQVSGTYVYQITPRIQEQLARLIAGKPQQQAIALLLKSPGIAGAQITMRGGDQTLPQDLNAIRILVQYNG